MFHNSNRRVADWIVALGARVNGPALLSVWTLRTPPDRPAQPTPAQPRPSELIAPGGRRSEEHTSELQSLMRISYAVFFLQKKKNDNISVASQLKALTTYRL